MNEDECMSLISCIPKRIHLTKRFLIAEDENDNVTVGNIKLFQIPMAFHPPRPNPGVLGGWQQWVRGGEYSAQRVLRKSLKKVNIIPHCGVILKAGGRGWGVGILAMTQRSPLEGNIIVEVMQSPDEHEVMGTPFVMARCVCRLR